MRFIPTLEKILRIFAFKMKKHTTILFLIGFLFSCSIKKSPYPKTMIQAEECIVAHPDSALFYLSTLEKDIKNEPEETQMYYNLLTIKAKDKSYIIHTSDSLIKVITKFYENYGDSDKLMEAYYYLGSIYRDMKDAPRALKAFQEAINTGKDSKQYDILAQIHGQMGTLFAWQDLYNESLEATKKSLFYYRKSNNAAKISIVTRNIARIYNTKACPDSTLWYYNKAYNQALKYGSERQACNILSELGCYYYDLGEKDTAKIILLNVASDKRYMPNALLKLGIIYQETIEDSAQYYFNETLKYGDIYKRRSAYKGLAEIEAKRKNYYSALCYEYKYQKIRDSIDNITKTEAINKIQSLYNYQISEKENNHLKLENENKKELVYKLLLAFMICIIIFLYIILYIKKKKQVMIEQERKLRKLKEEQYAQSLELIENNKHKLHELELQLYRAEEKNDSLNKQLIQFQKEQIELSNRQVLAVRNEQDLLELSFKQSDIYLLFHKISNDETLKITDNEWTALQISIDKTYHNFTDRLYTLYPQLSLLELRICYLIKISMQVKDIAKLVIRSKPAITAARIRLYKKIHGIEGTGDMLDQFIINL